MAEEEEIEKQRRGKARLLRQLLQTKEAMDELSLLFKIERKGKTLLEKIRVEDDWLGKLFEKIGYEVPKYYVKKNQEGEEEFSKFKSDGGEEHYDFHAFLLERGRVDVDELGRCLLELKKVPYRFEFLEPMLGYVERMALSESNLPHFKTMKEAHQFAEESYYFHENKKLEDLKKVGVWLIEKTPELTEEELAKLEVPYPEWLKKEKEEAELKKARELLREANRLSRLNDKCANCGHIRRTHAWSGCRTFKKIEAI